MNIYRCWYHGTSGFAGRLDQSNWLFVPELGQINSRIYRGIPLTELVFHNRFEYEHEVGQSAKRFSIRCLLQSIFFPFEHAQTTAGMLLLPGNK